MINILIADDHEVVRKGLVLVLGQEEDFNIVGEARNGREALEKIPKLKPDLVLLDWKMPEMNGLDAAAELKRHHPTVRTLLLSGAPLEEAALDALDGGVDGFVHKDISPADLARAVREVASGKTYIGQEVIAALKARSINLRQEVPMLTPRETEVLKLMATASTYREIGAQLFISEETVRSHAKRILVKLEQPNRTQAVIAAMRSGLIELE